MKKPDLTRNPPVIPGQTGSLFYIQYMELLSDRQPNEAYLAAKPGEQYALYFTHGGSVGIDLSESNGTFKLKWISITEGKLFEEANIWFPDVTIQCGSVVTITAPFKGGWVVAITRDYK